MTSDELRVGKEERRAWPVERLEVRAEAGAAPEITGYAALFNELSLDLGGWRERIAPGAFARSVMDNDVRALWDHDSKYVLGRNRSGTMELEEDERGLGVVIRPPETGWARDLLLSMKRGDVSQMSFGFYVRDEDWVEEDGIVVRVLRDVDLFDVSVVTYTAYPQTSAEARQRATSFEVIQPGTADDDEAVTIARARGAKRTREIEILGI